MMLAKSWVVWVAVVASHISSTSASMVTDPAPPTATYDIPQLFKRQDTCPANTFRCNPDLGPAFKDICCQTGQTCALDGNNQPACCPSGAVCTGTAPATAATGVPAMVVSYVPNAYFSFPYAATTFGDQAACTSAVNACSKNYDTCVTVLNNGAGYGVTIVVPGGGGTTVGGGAGAYGASATPICSSLSSKACSNLEATPCSSYKESDSSTTRANFYLAALGAAAVLLRVLS